MDKKKIIVIAFIIIICICLLAAVFSITKETKTEIQVAPYQEATQGIGEKLPNIFGNTVGDEEQGKMNGIISAFQNENLDMSEITGGAIDMSELTNSIPVPESVQNFSDKLNSSMDAFLNK